MNELTNVVGAVGNYDGVQTSLTSDPLIVKLVDGLSINLTADKMSWASGPLTYTVTISNQAELDFETPVLTDIIDTTLVNFVIDSVYINDTKATQEQYTYDTETHILTVNLETIQPMTNATVTFQVTKAA